MLLLADKLDPSYIPTEHEEFMNEQQQAFFRQKLLDWRSQLIQEGQETISHMQASETSADEVDVACKEISYALELRTRDRERKLIARIDDALKRIDEGEYGYCKETGEPIGIRRLIARPIATLSIEAQERHERQERVYREAS